MFLIKMSEKNKILLISLFSYLKRYKKRLIIAVIAMLVLALIRGSIVYLLGPLIQDIFIDKNVLLLKKMFIILPILFVIRMLAEYTNNYFMNYIGQKIIQEIRSELFKHVHSLSMEFYWRKRSADIMSRVINDLNNIQSTVRFIPIYGVRDVLTVLSLTSVLFYINWKLAIIGVFVIPLSSYALKIFTKKMRKSSKESQDIISEISHKFQEALQGMAIVKAFNYEKISIGNFEKVNNEYFDKIMRYLRAASLSGPVMEFIGSSILLVLLYFGSKAIFSNTMSSADFFSFTAAFFTAYVPIKNISNMNSNLQMGLASWERVHQILVEKPSVIEIKDAKEIKDLKGKIEFKNVYYKYPTSDKWILENLNFVLNPNDIVAFVGPSGSGKSTIIQLLLRFFDPIKGDIFIDDVSLKELNIRKLREKISIVTQDTILFDDTIKNNILMGKKEAKEEEVLEAAKLADINSFISNMPMSYETKVGERAIKISGGQKQRIAIARAVIKKPRILLLDEATSNLDTNTEILVQKSIENALKDKTVIMVAHRLSTVKNANRIFVLKEGKIVEEGNHETLLSLKKEYHNLYKAQI